MIDTKEQLAWCGICNTHHDVDTFEIDHRESLLGIRAYEKLMADLNSRPDTDKLAKIFVGVVVFGLVGLIGVMSVYASLNHTAIVLSQPTIQEQHIAPKQGGTSDDTIDITQKSYAPVIHEDYPYQNQIN